MIRVAALLAVDRPGRGLFDQPPHRAHAAGGDPEPLLGEPGALELAAAADPADHGVLADLDVLEPDRGVAVRVRVREGWVADDLDAAELPVDQEQRRQL